MKTIGLLNTSIRTFNQGDYIIVESVKREMRELLDSAFVVELPTHAPVARRSEFGFRPYRNADFINLSKIEFSLLCGTNLIAKSVSRKWNQWNIQRGDTRIVNNVIAVGVGSAPGFSGLDASAKKVYSRTFSLEYIHSTRDERTARLLRQCGLKAVNTGCATMWSLTEEHCSRIPTEKSDIVVTTITDYKKSANADAALLRLLKATYREVYLWIQGIGDMDYALSLGVEKDIRFIPPNLTAYDAFLTEHECDYVGTRLHAGIKAMQKGRRAIVIGVDNRSADIAATYDINYVARGEIEAIEAKIKSRFKTNVGIDERAIETFKDQFVG